MRHAFCFHWDLQVVCALITSSCLPNGKCRDYELVYGSAGMLGVSKNSLVRDEALFRIICLGGGRTHCCQQSGPDGYPSIHLLSEVTRDAPVPVFASISVHE